MPAVTGWSARRRRARRDGVLILVMNLSVPLDRRVWLEAQALVGEGRPVSVICPRGETDRAREELSGVRIYRFRPPPPALGVLGYVREFLVSWLRAFALALVVFVRDGFAAIQACNPPDTLFAIAAPYKLLGIHFVFDQHDLCPEIFDARFGPARQTLRRLLLALERATYVTADRVISTNNSYRSIALDRGGRTPDDVVVVRSGPPSRFRRQAPRPELREGKRHLCCYLGVMGPQDGVDLLIRAVDVIVHQLGRDDCQFAVLGFGDCESELRQLSSDLGLDEWVSFTGRADERMISEYLSTADLGISPDPRNDFNNRSTMNKVLEYMAMGLPVVAFDLDETRVSAADAGEYARSNDVQALARSIVGLLDDSTRREAMGRRALERIEHELGWEHQAPRYTSVYDELLTKTEA
jgi:glycosyltransferase involved in cell wall biosynthesis